jgi:hypothetical protein
MTEPSTPQINCMIDSAKKAIKSLLSSLFTKHKPDLVLANSHMSFSKSVAFKLIRTPMKALLTVHYQELKSE